MGATKPQRRRNPHGEENEHFEDGLRHDYHHNAEYENADNGPEEQYSPTDHQPRSLKDGSPIDWFLQNPSKKMKSLLDQAIDAELPDKIIEMISHYENKVGQTTCLKMLMCKSSPIIWGMQNSLKKRINGEENSTKEQAEKSAENKRPFSTESFYTHMPSLDEFREHGAKCDKLYSNYCNTTELHRKKRY